MTPEQIEQQDAETFKKRQKSILHRLEHILGLVDWCATTTVRDGFIVNYDACVYCNREQNFVKVVHIGTRAPKADDLRIVLKFLEK